MRSSVSYILSSSVSEPNMSHPDYEQYSHDHAALLILVKQIGNQLKPKIFTKFYERINKLTSVKITDSTGAVRNILLRYIKDHPVENNDWGDFQTHRRLLGLITLGKYDSQQELNEICRVHESLKVKYNSTLFDSRCILFGVTQDAESPGEDNPPSSSSGDSENSVESPLQKFTTPSNFKARALFYDVSSPCADLESQLNEFINSLFWVLDSKRVDRSREKLERVSLLLAPFEKKDFVGLDMESRNNKKRCTGIFSSTEQKELAIQLQSLSSQCEGSPVPLVLDSGLVVPPANLTDIPICAAFVPKDLQPHLRPRRIENKQTDTGPFLFTPIHFGGGSLERKSRQASSKLDFLWIQNEVCEVQLKLINPLPFELKVSNMRLLTGGVVFESVPETIVLPPDIPTSLTLNGWARESGELELSGYSTHTLGVKSNCRLRHMGSSMNFPPYYKVQVVPSLPLLEVSTSFPTSASFSNFHDENTVTSASVSLYHGESTKCIITLKNASEVPVEMLEVEVNSVLDPSLQDQIFSWDREEVKKLLPIPPGETVSITLNLHSAANFLAPTSAISPTIPHDMSSGPFSSMSTSLPGGSLPSRFNSSFRSSNSGHSSLAGGLTNLFQQQPSTSIIEGQLKLKYSGSEGFASEYCRSCSVFVMLEMLPSLQVTNWDVLPADTHSQFYLVLDVANLTTQEMELQYTPTKTMLIEGQESCRVPIPVDRCPLSKLTGLFQEMDENSDNRNDIDVNKICSEHVTDLVSLNWHLLGTDSRGVASLKGINLTPRMLDIVRMSPLGWGKFIFSLIFRRSFTELQPQAKANHECNVIFFTPGHYKVDIQCCAPESLLASKVNPIISTGHIWRFTPTVSFLVT
uniref:Protein brunelleschi-like n=1 Tax=Diabrotica virgifera virgifera TaxID=50390 RepID=A0A6P7GIX4_DIAVI